MAYRRSASIQPSAARAPPRDRVARTGGDGSLWHRASLGAVCATARSHGDPLPSAYVPYVRRNKTDRTDAEALLEAMRSGQIPSVPVKSVAQQTLVALHRLRDQWMTTRTARINTLPGILREQGLLLLAGAGPAVHAIPAVVEDADTPIADSVRHMIALMYDEICGLERHIAALDRELRALVDADPVTTRIREIPGIGLLTATALVCTVGHIHAFRRARQFASWLGLRPREYSSGTRRLGGISKRGDVYLRCLLTHGARAVLRAAQHRLTTKEPLTRLHQWALTVQTRRGHNKAAIAVANKLGRIVWAVWHFDVPFVAVPAARSRTSLRFFWRC